MYSRGTLSCSLSLSLSLSRSLDNESFFPLVLATVGLEWGCVHSGIRTVMVIIVFMVNDALSIILSLIQFFNFACFILCIEQCLSLRRWVFE